eukprot:1196053-Prorocentrum_minimum.AAC.8
MPPSACEKGPDCIRDVVLPIIITTLVPSLAVRTARAGRVFRIGYLQFRGMERSRLWAGTPCAGT